MTSVESERVYHRLVVVADPTTVIWLVDDCWHPVQKAIGTLDTRVLPGRYFIELGPTGLQGVAYPIDLVSDLQLTQDVLRAGPACQRQPPKLLEDESIPNVAEGTLRPVNDCLTLARQIVDARLDADAQARIDELATKASRGTLSVEEREEYAQFVECIDLMGIIKAKARRLLRERNSG